MTPQKLATAIAVVAILVMGGFVVGRYLVAGGGGSEAKQPSISNQLDQIATQQAIKDSEARFVGQLLGIALAPSVDQIPKEFWEEDERLSSAGCTTATVSVQQADSLDFPRALPMPDGYTLADEDRAHAGTNPWVLACGDTVRSMGWDYDTVGIQGIYATVSVVRSIIKYDTQSVAKSQVSTQTIGGRDAMVISPASSLDLAQRYMIYFPESFGMTSIQTFNLDQDAALKIAEAVAGASQ